MKTMLKTGAVFIGTIVGAGLASGQEILVFFSRYGIKGYYGILLCTALYILISTMILKLCYAHHLHSYKAIIQHVFPGSIGSALYALTTFFIFTGNIVMLSGSGAMLHEYLGIPVYFGILTMASVSFLVVLSSTRGLIALNSIIVPFSSAILLLLGILVLKSMSDKHITGFTYTGASGSTAAFLFSSVLYASFNLLAVTGVLCPMTRHVKNPVHFASGILLGSLVLMLMSFSIHTGILYYAPESLGYEIPNLYISQFYSPKLSALLTVILWLEMLSTEVSDLYSMGKAFQHSTRFSYARILAVLVVFSIPIAFIGFSRLIRLLYPMAGVCGLLFTAGCCCQFIKER